MWYGGVHMVWWCVEVCMWCRGVHMCERVCIWLGGVYVVEVCTCGEISPVLKAC